MNPLDRLTRRRSSRLIWGGLLAVAAAGLFVASRSATQGVVAGFGVACGVLLFGAVLSLRSPLSTQWTRDPDPAVEAMYDDIDRLQVENRRLRRQVEAAAENNRATSTAEFDRLRARLAATRQELDDARAKGASAGPDPGARARPDDDEEVLRLREALRRSEERREELRASIDAGEVDPTELDERVSTLRSELRKAQSERALLRDALQSSERELHRAREAVRAYEADEPSDLDERIRELQTALRRSEAERALLRTGRPESVWEARVGELERQVQGAEARAAALGAVAGGAEETVSRLEHAESERLAAEDRARRAEQRAIGLEQRARELSQEVRTRLAEAEEGVRSAVAGELERLRHELTETSTRLRDAEARAEEAAARDSGERLAPVPMLDPATLAAFEERVVEAERRAREAELRLHEILMTDEERASAEASEMRSRLARVAGRKRLGGAGDPQEAQLVPRAGPIADLQAAVAYELRSPVATLRGLSLALRGAVDTADGRDLVRQLGSRVRKIDQLVTDLGAVAKLADGSIRLRRRRTDLTALVTRVVDEADGFENRVLLLDGEPLNLSVDAARLEQIVDSLLTNARSRTTKGQTIRVNVRGTDDGGVTISVDDDGRADPAIGPELSLAVRLAELHGGRLWLEPLSKGASFRVELPGAARSAARGATSA
jgi:hypothetical protein